MTQKLICHENAEDCLAKHRHYPYNPSTAGYTVRPQPPSDPKGVGVSRHIRCITTIGCRLMLRFGG